MTPEEAWVATRAATQRSQPPPVHTPPLPSPQLRPIRPLGPRSFARVLLRRFALADFARRVMALHQVDTAGACSCGINAVLCPYVRLAREVFDAPGLRPLPERVQPLPVRRPSPHPVEFRPPRPYPGEL